MCRQCSYKHSQKHNHRIYYEAPMKRIFLILSTFALFLLTSCNTTNPDISNTNADSTVEIPKPNQEVLFVITHTNFSDDVYSSASIIDSNGNYHYLPNEFDLGEENWYQVVLDSQKTDTVRSIEQSHLKTIYRFVNEFDVIKSYDTMTYEHFIFDYGYLCLYEIYMDSDKKMNYKLLCQYGQEVTCVNSETVKEFVNWMTDKNYFFIDDFKY